LQDNPLDNNAHLLIELYTKSHEEKIVLEKSEEWRKNNLEYDLRSSDYIVEKCKNEVYAQNLYAALCNNDFMRNDVWPILKGETWGCSWRYAGGIIADILQHGDYLDWYCSGITTTSIDMGGSVEHNITTGYVSEGEVTDEIREDLFKLGWIVQPETTD
jgi:hypothetical protein